MLELEYLLWFFIIWSVDVTTRKARSSEIGFVVIWLAGASPWRWFSCRVEASPSCANCPAQYRNNDKTWDRLGRPRRLALLFKIQLPVSQIVIQPSSVRRYENKNEVNYISNLNETPDNCRPKRTLVHFYPTVISNLVCKYTRRVRCIRISTLCLNVTFDGHKLGECTRSRLGLNLTNIDSITYACYAWWSYVEYVDW